MQPLAPKPKEEVKPAKASAKHPNCIKCGLHEECRTPFMRPHAYYPEKVERPILCVGEAPGAQEDRVGYPFCEDGDSGDLLRQTLAKYLPKEYVFLERMDDGTTYRNVRGVYMHNAISCRPKDNKLTSATPINMCRTFVQQHIEKIRPAFILMLGASALKSVFKETGITTKRREVKHYELADGTKIPCVAAFHPSFALRDTNQLPSFDGDIEYFCNVVAGKKTNQAATDYVKGVNIYPTAKDVRAMHRRAIKSGCLTAVDCETNGLRPELIEDFRITALGIYNHEDFLVVRLDTLDGLCQDDELLEAVHAYMQDKRCRKSAHNAKYEQHTWARRFGYQIAGMEVCTKLEHAQIYPFFMLRDLDVLTQNYLGMPKSRGVKDQLDALKAQGYSDGEAWLRLDWEPLALYCAADTKQQLMLHEAMVPELLAEDEKWKKHKAPGWCPSELFRRLTMPALHLLQEVEANGMLVDPGYMSELEVKYVARLDEIQQQVNKLKIVSQFKADKLAELFASPKSPKSDKGKESARQRMTFNIGSDDQCRGILFDRRYFGIKPDPKALTPTKKPKVDKEVVDELIFQWGGTKAGDFLALRREYKKIDKNLGTYLRGLQPYVDKRFYVHGQYTQDVVETGRISCKNPNLQNQKGDKELRRVFIAPKGHYLVAFDYSQIELRVLAAFSGDEDMMGIYQRGEDLHAETQQVITEMGIFDSEARADWDKEKKRRHAKTVNFGIVYLISKYGLSRKLDGEDLEVCQQMIDGVYNRFPGIMDWQDDVRNFAAKYGRVYTMFGNWRELQNCRIKPRNYDDELIVEAAMRQAVNARVQGTASHCSMVGAMRLNRYIKKYKLRARIVNLIHDAAYLYVHKNDLEETLEVGKAILEEEPVNWIGKQLRGVPILVEAKVGRTWADMESEDTFMEEN